MLRSSGARENPTRLRKRRKRLRLPIHLLRATSLRRPEESPKKKHGPRRSLTWPVHFNRIGGVFGTEFCPRSSRHRSAEILSQKFARGGSAQSRALKRF